MNIHQNSEDEHMKYNCSICGKQMLTKKKLKQHEDAVHKNKGFKCTECDHWVKSRNPFKTVILSLLKLIIISKNLQLPAPQGYPTDSQCFSPITLYKVSFC